MSRTCPDCGVKPGEAHEEGCDVERCSSCAAQFLSCGCEDHDPSKSKWTGEWPGISECRDRGWYAVMEPDRGISVSSMGNWWPCTENYPGAHEDLNRLSYFSQTGEDPHANTPVLGRDIE